MHWKFHSTLLWMLVVGWLLVACVPAQPVSSPGAEGAAGGTLTLGLGSEPETLDPGDAVYVQEQLVLINLFDSLLSMAPDTTGCRASFIPRWLRWSLFRSPRSFSSRCRNMTRNMIDTSKSSNMSRSAPLRLNIC